MKVIHFYGNIAKSIDAIKILTSISSEADYYRMKESGGVALLLLHGLTRTDFAIYSLEPCWRLSRTNEVMMLKNGIPRRFNKKQTFKV